MGIRAGVFGKSLSELGIVFHQGEENIVFSVITANQVLFIVKKDTCSLSLSLSMI